jgi:transglutaminase-like putative cysteine protease
VARTLLAALLPAVGVTAAWLALEGSPQARDGVLVAALAVVPALLRHGAVRVAACAVAALGAGWIAFGAQPWELVPFRDERVLGPALEDAANGVVDFYAVFLPFEPGPNPEMHSLVLCAIFGFVLAAALLIAARRALAAAAVTVAGIGWPATLLGGKAVAVGALALAAALAIPLVLRASSLRMVLAGGLVAAVVIAGAAATSSATTLARDPALDWETWDLRGEPDEITSVRFIWESNYGGVRFPARRTVVFKVDGPTRPMYWRASTLDLFTDDHWFDNLLWLGRVEGGEQARLASSSLTPVRVSQRRNWTELAPNGAQRRSAWIEQEVEIEAYDDDHVVAAGTPMAVDARRLGTVFQLSGSVLRSLKPLRRGKRYRVWSYVPDPSPAQLASARAIYPAAAERFLEFDGREFPAFAAPARRSLVREFFADPSYQEFRRYRPMYELAARVTEGARTPYAAVLALESWLRQTGGFTYDESPPRVKGVPPLVAFVSRTRAGYCQHFAGAMAAMLRMLGIPARVAVGFTSGSPDEGRWAVADRDAHAWVEVWFRGHGWIPFDPTPGRGTFAGAYSYASDSDAAVAALRRGQLGQETSQRTTRVPDAGDLPGDTFSADVDSAPSLVGVGLVLAAAWVLLLGLGKAAVRRARYLSRDPRRLATASRRELEDFLRDQGAAVPRNATLATLQRAVQQELGLDARLFADAAARARFGPPGSGEQAASAPRREVRRLLRAARRDLSVWARLRGLVSLRSLRAAGAAGT